jgi:TonB family protein
VIKATVVLLLARALIPRLTSRSAAERHLLWMAALGAATVLPLLDATLPAWQPAWTRGVAAVLPASLAALGRWRGGGADGIVVRATGLEPASWFATVVAYVWVAGTLLALAYLAAQFVRLYRMRASADPVHDARLRRVFDAAAGALAVRRRPELLQTPRLAIPITWGVRRPVVLLPTAASTWSEERLRAVFCHELAHVRRLDWPLHVVVEIACAIYWFHPLVWLARRHAHREGERAADDVVLTLGIDGRDYAGHLLDVVRGSRPASPAPTIAMGRAPDLPSRIDALVRGAANRSGVTRAKALAAVAVTTLVALPVGALALSRVASDIQVRAARLPSALLAAVSPAAEATTAVRDVRLASGASAAAVTPPEVVEYTTPPLYSDEARSRGVEGVVVVRARVGLDGRSTDERVIEGLGHGLDQNALVALRHWRFRPGTRDGVPGVMEADVHIEFSLRQERLNEWIANDMATQVGPDVTAPRAVVTPRPPDVPGAQGTVVLDVVLLEDGTPRIVRVLGSVSPEADEVAVRTFERWRFSPATSNGAPVKVRLTAEVRFHG